MANSLGKLADKFDTRDAFHVACVGVLGSGEIRPGDDVKFTSVACNIVQKCERSERHAIADPFLPAAPLAGEPFWVVLCPESTQNLSHNFDIVLNGVVQKAPEPDLYYDEDDYGDECRGCN